jgi:hypothetical protein
MVAKAQDAYRHRFASIWCGMASRTFDPLARRLCKTVHQLMEAPPDQWVALSKAAKEMNVTNKELIDGAVTHALQMGWLMGNGKPVHSLVLTATGLAAALKKK